MEYEKIIVQWLAETYPIVVHSDGSDYCFFCHNELKYDFDIDKHEKGCVWRMANELRKAENY